MRRIITIIGWLISRCWKAELRALERICLEQARLCALPESRAALRELARNYRAAAEGQPLSSRWQPDG
jgi:hypothetical protein